MANRSMVAKAERAERQRRELGTREGAKFDRPSEREQAKLLATLAASFKGVVVKHPAGEAAGLSRSIGREGKGRRSLVTKCYGNGERRTSTFRDYWSQDTVAVVMVLVK